MAFCIQCGNELQQGDRFCYFCGAPIPEGIDADISPGSDDSEKAAIPADIQPTSDEDDDIRSQTIKPEANKRRLMMPVVLIVVSLLPACLSGWFLFNSLGTAEGLPVFVTVPGVALALAGLAAAAALILFLIFRKAVKSAQRVPYILCFAGLFLLAAVIALPITAVRMNTASGARTAVSDSSAAGSDTGAASSDTQATLPGTLVTSADGSVSIVCPTGWKDARSESTDASWLIYLERSDPSSSIVAIRTAIADHPSDYSAQTYFTDLKNRLMIDTKGGLVAGTIENVKIGGMDGQELDFSPTVDKTSAVHKYYCLKGTKYYYIVQGSIAPSDADVSSITEVIETFKEVK